MVQLNSTQYFKLGLQYSSLAFLYYDYILTIELEIHHFWNKPFRLSTLLYICCRYALLANLLYIFAITDILDEVCNVWYQVIAAISILGRIGVMTVMTLRTYIVWSQNMILLVFLGLLETASIVLSCIKVPKSVCGGVIVGSALRLTAALPFLVLIFEFLVTLLTLIRTHQALESWKRCGLGYKDSIMYLFWEHGVLYFLVVFGLQLAAIILPSVAPGGFPQRLFSAFTLPLSGLLSARFLLHLQEWGDAPQKEFTQGGSKLILSTSSSLEPHMTFMAVNDYGCDPASCSVIRGPVTQ